MIGYLKGKVKKLEGNTVLLDVNGVGYKVFVPGGLGKFSPKNELELFIHTHVKEDALSLFGFEDEEGLKIFEMLISVSGVGPKTALGILVGMNPAEIRNNISLARVGEFTKIPGIGKKVAQKIIVELQSKTGSKSELDLKDTRRDVELIEALTNLGFDTKEAKKLSENIDPALPINERIKLSLRSKR